ncbi:MAG: 30S ribosomal protein S4 [Elusimicrobia bacterium CG1_02_37_114]|nr:MAG: 30S ribosomal protein S4 [Elusimicrobia bacterium CG1_02_37_114]PIV52543.1 MAG: 30S ribosomal protein S4 [Elusimicrobia bacterium CG02_land_8_20_14_3_00_37_13]PIZ13272.1 MAG: 30S ribosomal protein S4 [Elusimicrobia bacterium CG_4_10_14_0_8_um_filter_37_32]
MGRYTGPLCKLCRREKTKLFLKGEKCDKNCVIDRIKQKGKSGQSRQKRMVKLSEYAKRLHEKQKMKHMAGLTEEQFRNYYRQALKMPGMTGEQLLLLVETRLDSVLHRLGFAPSKRFARQLVTHRHITVNDRIMKFAGYRVKPGDKIKLRESVHENPVIKKSLEKDIESPSWLSVDKTNFAAEVLSVPSRSEISYPIDETLIVELYSR